MVLDSYIVESPTVLDFKQTVVFQSTRKYSRPLKSNCYLSSTFEFETSLNKMINSLDPDNHKQTNKTPDLAPRL